MVSVRWENTDFISSTRQQQIDRVGVIDNASHFSMQVSMRAFTLDLDNSPLLKQAVIQVAQFCLPRNDVEHAY